MELRAEIFLFLPPAELEGHPVPPGQASEAAQRRTRGQHPGEGARADEGTEPDAYPTLEDVPRDKDVLFFLPPSQTPSCTGGLHLGLPGCPPVTASLWLRPMAALDPGQVGVGVVAWGSFQELEWRQSSQEQGPRRVRGSQAWGWGQGSGCPWPTSQKAERDVSALRQPPCLPACSWAV